MGLLVIVTEARASSGSTMKQAVEAHRKLTCLELAADERGLKRGCEGQRTASVGPCACGDLPYIWELKPELTWACMFGAKAHRPQGQGQVCTLGKLAGCCNVGRWKSTPSLREGCARISLQPSTRAHLAVARHLWL